MAKNSQHNLQSILFAMRNGDYDHFGDSTIAEARSELKQLLNCDDWDLGELLKQFIKVKVQTTIVFVGTNPEYSEEYTDKW